MAKHSVSFLAKAIPNLVSTFSSNSHFTDLLKDSFFCLFTKMLNSKDVDHEDFLPFSLAVRGDAGGSSWRR